MLKNFYGGKATITLYVVQGAQSAIQDGEKTLVPFSKVFTSLERAAKWVVRDYNRYIPKGDGGRLSGDSWKQVAKGKFVESPSSWNCWVKWCIVKQAISL